MITRQSSSPKKNTNIVVYTPIQPNSLKNRKQKSADRTPKSQILKPMTSHPLIIHPSLDLPRSRIQKNDMDILLPSFPQPQPPPPVQPIPSHPPLSYSPLPKSSHILNSNPLFTGGPDKLVSKLEFTGTGQTLNRPQGPLLIHSAYSSGKSV